MSDVVTIGDATLYCGDCRDILPTLADGSVNCCVTSPPYFGLRDYGVDGQIGLEPTPDEFVGEMTKVFREVRRVLTDDGTLWLNLGDSYANSLKESGRNDEGRKCPKGLNAYAPERANRKRHASAVGVKSKDLIGIPWRVALALQADGWYLRSDIIWHKPNPMPESVRDRPTKAHEYVFLLTKSAKYWYDADALKEKAVTGTDLGLLRGRSHESGNADGSRVAWHAPSIAKRQMNGVDSRTANEAGARNARSVWSITPKPFSGAHFATMPPKLAERCILAGCPEGGTVLDPFTGAGTTGIVAVRNGRRFIGSELNESYLRDIITPRIRRAVQDQRSQLPLEVA